MKKVFYWVKKEQEEQKIKEREKLCVKYRKVVMTIYFLNYVKRGDLNGVQQYFQTNLDNITNDQIKHAFFIVCLNGYLNIAQWLYQVKPDVINKTTLDHAFRRSLSLAYSVSLGTDDQRNQKHIDVAEWLTTFSPEYDIQIAYKPIITSNPNIIERNKKKIKWYKKKNMVWLSSQEPGSTGDNLVARLPTDVVRISSSYL
jgi:hypothetical protein